jgi:hypothetical protein
MSLVLYAFSVTSMNAGWPQWKSTIFFALGYAFALWSWLMPIWAVTHDFAPVAMVWLSSLAMLLPLLGVGFVGYLDSVRVEALARRAASFERAVWRQTSQESLAVYERLVERFGPDHRDLREFHDDPEFMRRFERRTAYR